MSDIELVVKIPKELYEAYKGRPPMLGDAGMDMIAQSIANGTPLPKGHGRLIDADELEELFGEECVSDCGACMPKRKTDGKGRWYDTCSLIDKAPTIIDADKEKKEEIDPLDFLKPLRNKNIEEFTQEERESVANSLDCLKCELMGYEPNYKIDALTIAKKFVAKGYNNESAN